MLGGSEECIRDPEFFGFSGVLLEIYLRFLHDCRTFDLVNQEERDLSVGNKSTIGIRDLEVEIMQGPDSGATRGIG